MHDIYLKNISRISPNNYNKIKQDIYNKLSSYLELKYPIEYIRINEKDKIFFRDLDILYKLTINTQICAHVYSIIVQLFSPIEIFFDGDIISFSYYFSELNEYYQINLINQI